MSVGSVVRRWWEAPYWYFRRRRELLILRKTRQYGILAESELCRLTDEVRRLESLLSLREMEVKQLLTINERNNQRIAWEISNFARKQAENLHQSEAESGGVVGVI
jgi:hypothetical protein